MAPGNANAAPAYAACTKVGGTFAFGNQSANGGGLADGSNVIVPCTFADGSFVEVFGLAYYANNQISGKDLKTVFRFDTSKITPVYT